MAPSIPDRWIPYKACGSVIEGTRFICFKVPLKTSVQEGKPEIKEIWDISALLSQIPNLGAVIDLTNTTRYYNPKDLEAKGVLHKKILMPGRIIPPENKVTEFMTAVDEFLGKDCDSLIGVHCTHGLNRTGYMVCRYMRDRLRMPAKDAIEKFEKARGYRIERENYVADILNKKPPPPDVFKKNTIIRPVTNQNNFNYWSPVADDGHNQYYNGRYGWRNDRYNNNSRRSHNSYADRNYGTSNRRQINNFNEARNTPWQYFNKDRSAPWQYYNEDRSISWRNSGQNNQYRRHN